MTTEWGDCVCGLQCAAADAATYVGHINEVALRRAQLVLGWVTVSRFNTRCGIHYLSLTSYPGQLSLAIPMGTSQWSVMLCSWLVRAWLVAGKTVWSHVKRVINKHYRSLHTIKSTLTFTLQQKNLVATATAYNNQENWCTKTYNTWWRATSVTQILSFPSICKPCGM